MLGSIKKLLYFPIAGYFRFFAKIKLARWKPRVVVITGSAGKTTTMNLAIAQLRENATYSHHANSSFGIPFNILGIHRETLQKLEWINIFLSAPIKAFSSVPRQKIYVVEADCDRPNEGIFLSEFLKPEVTIWLSSSRTHSMNFDYLVSSGKFKNVEEAIAYEYGYFLENTSKLVIINSDSDLIMSQLIRSKADVIKVTEKSLKSYKVSTGGTEYQLKNDIYKFRFLLPRAISYSISAILELTNYLGFSFDDKFDKFDIPPGRSSIFEGVKNTTIVDSCYNSSFSSATEIINMFNLIKADNKWAVIGDMLEQGEEEKEEHEKLAKLVVKSDYEKVILLGPRIKKHGFSILENHYGKNVVSFVSPKDVLDYLTVNIKGGETILFKGARFMEGIIENILKNKQEASKLSRREKIWEIRRKQWGL
ncbi:MAG TPA: hypothetical protein VG965_05750 [Patescibacteria group bacterium]|nr:hypothetical protein [Patescibacteria group bacterium]